MCTTFHLLYATIGLQPYNAKGNTLYPKRHELFSHLLADAFCLCNFPGHDRVVRYGTEDLLDMDPDNGFVRV
jgi:hypothetical protein